MIPARIIMHLSFLVLLAVSFTNYSVLTSTIVIPVPVPQGNAAELAENPNKAGQRNDYSNSSNSAPTVQVKIADNQPDPTDSSPITFVVTFSEVVYGFQSSDISFNGSTTLGTLTATITGSGPSYIITVTGMTDTGNVVLSIPSNVVENSLGYPNTASVSLDNSVYYNASDVQGEWQITGSMNIGRSGHTATLLKNGKVLVAGGHNASVDLSTAELFDPVSKTWAMTGAMSEKRYGHTATLLPDGTVLVSGGMSTYCGKNTAEIYDPSTGTWHSTSAMHSARYWHTSTLMANGNVLVAGGKDCGSLASAEIYNPITGVWRVVSSMNYPRDTHTATLLNNNRIFVVAGDTYTTELYNPATDSWIITAPVENYENGQNAVLLRNGDVLIAGGNAAFSHCAKLYNQLKDSWTQVACGEFLTDQFSMTLLDNGMILGAGGYWGPNTIRPELFDQVNGVWLSTALLNGYRYSHTSTLLNDGRVLIAGGFDGYYQQYLSTAEIFIKPITVKINQADGQTDPTQVSHIDFFVTFSEAVSSFDSSDISFTGSTAPGNLTASISGTGPSYRVSVTGMTGDGKVAISIPADVTQDIYGKFSNLASTNIDNVVTYYLMFNIFVPYVTR